MEHAEAVSMKEKIHISGNGCILIRQAMKVKNPERENYEEE